MSKTINASDLGIHLKRDDENALFNWFIASFLMGKRIQADIAAQAYRVIVEKHARDTVRKLASCTHRELVSMLGEARYVRYDETTAARLLSLSKKMIDDYAGGILNIHVASEDRQAFEKRLSEFEGVGPKTVEIFMRDAAAVLY
ncbi:MULTISPECIES: DNA methylase [unclassified Pseudomonas]|uniref:DNA methylase n=1 Tax=Pseudomonas sp. Ant30-3 TaxID=1488328 RepID=UPI00048B74FE|nr:DNA methylase [Pseudomonas sp. Ant30-3]